MRQARKSRMKYWPQYILNTIASMVNGTTPSSREIREIDQVISAQFLSPAYVCHSAGTRSLGPPAFCLAPAAGEAREDQGRSAAPLARAQGTPPRRGRAR